ncbi:MAG: DUF721 domain-containing protein [Bacteroidaceae bacterium]|nr:DUF721 domain-containing protein [Bacteroidaceae bacterium]
MFRKREEKIGDILREFIREEGLETPLLQRRLIDSWQTVVGEAIAAYTDNLYIRNQNLFVHVNSSVIRAELSMQRTSLVKKLNETVKSTVITDIRFC